VPLWELFSDLFNASIYFCCMGLSPTTLRNWLPYKLFVANNEPLCRWLCLEDLPIDDPFFEDTIGSARRLPVNTKSFQSTTSADILPVWSPDIDAVAPSAFVFHISRCGSTLLSQLLAIDPRNIVLSEVPFFDELLRLQYSLPALKTDWADQWLQSALQFYGQKRNGEEQHLVVKTDCWHIFFYERLRKLFPATPFVLLYRAPDEVLRSQQKRRGMQAVPGIVQPELIGLETTSEEPSLDHLDRYFARVMEKMLAAFFSVAEKDKNTLLVNYNEGMLTVTEKMADFSQIQISPAIKKQMKERAVYHGKYPAQTFQEEAAANSPDFLDTCWQWYHRLEHKRNAI
jgi:hypothetical protein